MNQANDDAPAPVIPGLPPTEEAAAGSTANGPTVSMAWKEAASLARNRSPEELALEAAEAEHGRNQKFRNHFEILALCTLNLSYFALSTIALVWALHLILPAQMRWLSAEDINHIQTLLTAGVLVGVVGNHFKKRLGD